MLAENSVAYQKVVPVDWYCRNLVAFVFIAGFFGIRVNIILVVCLGLSRNLF